MFFSLTLQAQDDFSLNFNPFNGYIDSNALFIANEYYMDVPSIFSTYDKRTSNYIILEGLVIYQNYYNVDCPEEQYWDICQFTNNFYEEFDSGLYIIGFRIITEVHYEN